jgi:hypothetical protein
MSNASPWHPTVPPGGFGPVIKQFFQDYWLVILLILAAFGIGVAVGHFVWQ